MEFQVTREHTFATSSTRSRCEWLLKNSRMVNDWNTVVEQLLLEKQRPKRKRKRKSIKGKTPPVTLAHFTETLENERAHRDRILEEHNQTIREINEELQHQREKSASTLKLAYLLRLEIAKQKALIAEQGTTIAQSETKLESTKVEIRTELQQELKDTKSELSKIQKIFLQQQDIMREIQTGTVTDVKETKQLLSNLQLQTSELIQMQKVHETTLEEKLRSLELEKETQNEELRAKLAASEDKIREMETKEDSEPETGPLEEQLTDPPSPTPEPTTSSEQIEQLTKTLSLATGTKVLARLTDEVNDGWFYRVTIVSSEGDRYRVDTGENLVDVTENDVVKIQGSDIELKREDTVIAKHPNYQSTYAPGVVVKVSSERVYQIRFYDGTEGLIPKTEAHSVSAARFENIVDFILTLEQRWIGETIVARDDRTGIYKLATVKDRLGSGHEYLVEWQEEKTSAIQHLTCIFGKYSKGKALQVGDHVISRCGSQSLEYLPGVIRGTQNNHLQIDFINESSTSDGEVKESFWISKEYFDLAHEYYTTQLEAATSESDTIRSD